jgi:hypothetical protein
LCRGRWGRKWYTEKNEDRNELALISLRILASDRLPVMADAAEIEPLKRWQRGLRWQKTVVLKQAGGVLKLTARFNPWELDGDERKLVR